MAELVGPWSDAAADAAVGVAAGGVGRRCLTKRERASRAFSRPFSERILTPRQAARSFAFSIGVDENNTEPRCVFEEHHPFLCHAE